MTQTAIDMTRFFTALCNYHGVTDQQELMNTDAFKTAYAEQASSSPDSDATSLMAKSLKKMRFITEGEGTIEAHCIEPNAKKINWDSEAGGFVTQALGVTLAMEDGRSKFIKFVDFDPLKTIEAQTPTGGFVEGLTRGAPVTLTNVQVSRDLYEGTVSSTITAKTTVTLGGHNSPFPEGPTLEYVIGNAAIQDPEGKQLEPAKWKGAWRLNKKTGTVTGEFGSIEGDPQVMVGEISQDVSEIRVNTFDDNPAKHHVQAVVYDSNGNSVRPKFYFDLLEEQLGIDGSTADPEAVKMQLAGQRVLLRGKGSILAMKEPKDFGQAWDSAYAMLQENGYFTNYGQKGLKRLALKDKKVRDAEGNDLGNQISVQVGDRAVYDIVQEMDKATGEKKWTLYTYSGDEGRTPWMDCVEHHFNYKRDIPDMGITAGDAGCVNEGAFIQFLEAVGGGAALAEDDPFLLAAQQMSLPVGMEPNVPAGATAETEATVDASVYE